MVREALKVHSNTDRISKLSLFLVITTFNLSHALIRAFLRYDYKCICYLLVYFVYAPCDDSQGLPLSVHLSVRPFIKLYGMECV